MRKRKIFSDSSVVANLYKQKFQQVFSFKGLKFYITSRVNCQNIRKNFRFIEMAKRNKNIFST